MVASTAIKGLPHNRSVPVIRRLALDDPSLRNAGTRPLRGDASEDKFRGTRLMGDCSAKSVLIAGREERRASDSLKKYSADMMA